MFTKEQRIQISKLVDEKNKLDEDMEALKKRMVYFNGQVKAITGKDELDWAELVKMLCAVDKYDPSIDEDATVGDWT